MVDLPILFPAPMVRGLISEVEQPGSGNTQTQRILTFGTMLDEAATAVAQAANGVRTAP